ncbi:hypothetical protein PMA3_19390 [Pseudomonas silesiensis]|uniref:DUF3077 domain-containing protein n=1 Tax=Pseudomonas silesiensis TaxID=1853130 RepID=A0A191YWD0_9PSED|nr:DUF6124 family protein [Pseudomonas silesiensis]ANJ57190.1 hypothetical protein PMA3_19390 [Pseudomonas silesiensis]
MIRSTPSPPESETPTQSTSQTGDHHHNPQPLKIAIPPHKPSPMFVVAPDIGTETLLAHACESLASASVMASDFAGFLEGSQRNTMLGIQQVIMLAELTVNRALDNVDPQD